MSLTKIKLWPYVIFSLLMILITPSLTTCLQLFFLVPCIVICFYQRSFLTCLWISFGFGLFIDLLSSDLFGLNILVYCLAVAILYRYKKHFFADSNSTLPICCFLFSSLCAILQILITYALDREIGMGMNWILSNTVIMPCLDALYAFFIFQVPTLIFGKRRSYGKDYFFNSAEG